METQIYKVRDPSGALREISGPAGATDEQVIAKAKELFGGQASEPIPQPVTQEPVKRGYGEALARQLGLTARYGIQGTGNTLDMLASPFRVGLNAILPKSQTLSGLVTGAEPTQAITGSTGASIADLIGLPKPETKMENVVGSATEAMASGGGLLGLGQKMMSAASPVVQGVGRLLASNPTSQLGLSAISGGSGEAAKQGGSGVMGQTAAAIGVPLATSVVAPTAGKILQIPYNIIAPTFSKDAANAGAAKMLNEVTGARSGGVANALTQALPEQTAGQAALDTGSAEMQAAQKLMRERRPSEYMAIDKAQKWDWRQQWKDLNKNTEAIRSKALDDANYGGVRADAITSEIDNILATAGSGRASKVVEGALNEVKSRIGKFTDETSGLIDAKDLYDIRKKIGTTIKNYSKENSDWDKTLASGLERDIQKAIDKEIVGAGGSNDWLTYLSQYSKEAKRLMAIKESAKEAKAFASAGLPETRVLMNKNENPIQGVNFLDRTMTLLNSALRRSEGAGGRKIEQAAADLMMPQNMGGDPRQLGLLMMQQARKPTTLDLMRQNIGQVPKASAMGLLNLQE